MTDTATVSPTGTTPPNQPATPTDDGASQREAAVETYESQYGWGLVILVAAWLGLGLVLLFVGADVEISGETVSLGFLVWVFGLLHFVAGIRIVEPSFYVGVLLLGRPTIIVSGNFVVAPPGIFSLVELTRGTIQLELPTEPELVFRKEDVEEVPKGMKPPIRITFANGSQNDPEYDETDPLEIRTTNEVSAFVRFRIRSKAHFWVFVIRIQSVPEAGRQLEDMSVSFMQERLTKLSVSATYRQLNALNQELDNLIRDRTNSWGIDLIDARIKLVGLSHRLNEKIQGIAEARADKRTTITTAEATERRLTLEGRGRANAVKAEIDARTNGMKRMATELGANGNDVLGAETARAIGEAPSTKVVVGADGFRQLAGVGVAIAEAIRPAPEQPQPSATPTQPESPQPPQQGA